MTVSSSTFIRDILFFIKDNLGNITDPLGVNRNSQSKFVMTSFPERLVEYPLITVKLTNQSAIPSGMQTTTMDVVIVVEIRVWARNQKEKDELGNDCYKRLRDIQFTAGGSRANFLHNFTLLSDVELDEPGKNQPKSRILSIQYKFFDT